MASKQSPLPASSIPQENGGGFGMGFFMGTVVGAMGMFLFGTDRGQDIIRHFKEELEKQAPEVEPEMKQQLEQTRTLIAKAMNEVKDKVEQVTEKKPIQSLDFPKFKRKNSS